MVNGVWQDVPRDTKATGGAFVRPESGFRARISAEGEYPPEPGRYRLYVSKACPWAHRTLVVRALKGLQKAVPVSFAAPAMLADGWEFPGDEFAYLHRLYAQAKRGYTGRATVPLLWDTRTRTIVNNESADIVRMLNREFDGYAKRALPDLYPASLRKEIDRINERVYRTVNNGVYRAGFATAQEKYEEAVAELFRTLDGLERQLAKGPWLCGRRFTEADVRLFTTLVRFDAVYYSHFKCNLRRLVDYPNLWHYTRRIYAMPGIARTVDLAEIKAHYYLSMKELNPSGIVPRGPRLDFGLPSSPRSRSA
jgi:putative glutathione S-transferase